MTARRKIELQQRPMPKVLATSPQSAVTRFTRRSLRTRRPQCHKHVGNSNEHHDGCLSINTLHHGLVARTVHEEDDDHEVRP